MPVIPEWLTLLLTYTGTGGILGCVMSMREVTRGKYPMWMLVLLWPLMLIGGALFERKPKISAAKQRQDSIAFWRAQLDADSPVEQELAKEMLAQFFSVPEKAAELESEKKFFVDHEEVIEEEYVATGGRPSGWTPLEMRKLASPSLRSTTRQQVKKTLQDGALSPLPPAERQYAQAYEKVVEKALEELHRRMVKAELKADTSLIDMIVDMTNELISTPAPQLPGIWGEYEPGPIIGTPDRSRRQAEAHVQLGWLIQHTVVQWAPQLPAAHAFAKTGDPSYVRMADYYTQRKGS